MGPVTGILARGAPATVIALSLAGCAPLSPPTIGERIVSIDYCADQMVLGLVGRAKIAAISSEAASDAGFSAPLAVGLPTVRPQAEDIIALRPTLVVRSYGGGPRMDAALRRAGIRVYTLPYAATLDDVGDALTSSGRALGAVGAARSRRQEWEVSITRARSAARRPLRALYMTPGDVTAGSDSFVAQLLTTAGYRIYDDRPGWNRLPLEQMVVAPPDIIVRAFFDSPKYRQDRWSSAEHGVIGALTRHGPVIDIAGSDIACGNWLSGRALDRLVAARTGSAS